MNILSDEALAHIIGVLRPLALMAAFYDNRADSYVVHAILYGTDDAACAITVQDLRTAKEIVDAYDRRLVSSA